MNTQENDAILAKIKELGQMLKDTGLSPKIKVLGIENGRQALDVTYENGHWVMTTRSEVEPAGWYSSYENSWMSSSYC